MYLNNESLATDLETCGFSHYTQTGSRLLIANCGELAIMRKLLDKCCVYFQNALVSAAAAAEFVNLSVRKKKSHSESKP